MSTTLLAVLVVIGIVAVFLFIWWLGDVGPTRSRRNSSSSSGCGGWDADGCGSSSSSGCSSGCSGCGGD